ncbi:hypothetical protein DEDE109153_03930 [Deinococcus deserti]|uniref:Uncharacterized protein n=1 Tax=Deinococcus deserti (strain DSM 17065 / CIP 109153 / LMG 22923 / VCD115) TaxID=546414 RepID=X5GXY2_DEIDV|nr:hypothetical protein [Deinococcus deserti]AHX26489.1 hypothetical protein Deide_05654 [Deinococcus deserti VCD115]
MLTVHLHLAGGDTIALEMSPSQKDRLSRTINQEKLPPLPFVAAINGMTVEIPWRSIAYLSSCPQVPNVALEAAD